MSKWEVRVYEPMRDGEISVVRLDRWEGRDSFGWHGEDKLIVWSQGGPCHIPCDPFVWERHLETAKLLCQRLNDA